MYMDTEANITQWLPVPRIIRILSYIEYVELFPTTLFPGNTPLESYQNYVTTVEEINKSTEKFYKNEDNYIFNEDKTGFMFKNVMLEIGGNEC